MNGAESLVRTLLAAGVDTCFTNPGTSELHFVAALDRVEGMRCVLCLFEGVATGAADGYARMTGRPATTLLHLGPGLGNGLANLHNARKAHTPLVNIVGEHARRHIAYDAPLTSDIEGIARPVSDWVRTAASAATVARDGAAAVGAACAPPGGVATLILPADTAWGEGAGVAAVAAPPAPPPVATTAVAAAVRALRAPGPNLILLGGQTLCQESLRVAAGIAQATGAALMAETFNARVERGRGRPFVPRLPYPLPQALGALAPYRRIVLIGARRPVAFFAYPDRPSLLAPEGCELVTLAEVGQDWVGALRVLAESLGAGPAPPERAPSPSARPPHGAIGPDVIGVCLAGLLPEQAIVVDEAITTGRNFFAQTALAAPHDWLHNRGGSIGIGLPLATGAALACPQRKVICLQADGSGMYTLQALWTQAREGLDVTTLLFANRAYAILRAELGNVGVGTPGAKARDLLSLDRPPLDWVALARGMGVSAVRVDDAQALWHALADALATPGPALIEVVL